MMFWFWSDVSGNENSISFLRGMTGTAVLERQAYVFYHRVERSDQCVDIYTVIKHTASYRQQLCRAFQFLILQSRVV